MKSSTLIRPAYAELDKDRACAVIRALGPKLWRVSVEKAKSVRSQQQNRYLWGCCYAAFMPHLPGWDAEDVHEYMLGEHFGWEVVEGFGKKRMRPIKRSSKLSKAEFADFVDFIQRKGAEMGIFVPDPETTE
jgi:hypothetical protein